ncbi:MAG: Ig-like domain-containing protein, partial [Verrucomicrobia bacterium]|nr:Ig-like domain-containing protein [Deltaproteobacteria bacterium]
MSSTVPANAATLVPIGNKLTVTFSEAMDPSTINTTTFTVKQGATSVTGTVSYSGVTAVFTPASNLATSTVFTARITTGAKTPGGKALKSDYVWTFTTGTAADTILPTVSSTVPVSAATGVATNSSVTATFSEAMDPSTITIPATFTVKQGATTVVPGTVTYSGVTAVFTPTSTPLAAGLYTATITTAAKDLGGNALAVNKVWSFTIGAAADTI